MDYGHDLAFGSFLTPTAANAERVVDLAVLSERVGLDLVTVQDHPYQPRFLDTWTLLSYLAARTRTVRLAANVTNLPLRPPAVLARSVASLDLLSGGRVELGLGAGAFWDAVEAMGGPRRTPGEAVEALEEAIDVIRQTWDADARGGVRVEGRHYRVVGAKRGPVPAHDVEIWVGAYKPRMLRLVGRRADGWLPSLGYTTPADLAAANEVLDEAAQDAGRSPRAVRRLLNVSGTFQASRGGLLQGPPAQWAAELADLALAQGFSTFVLATDDADDLRRYAAEVAPAVRGLVAAGRSATPAEGAAPASRAATATAPAPPSGPAPGRAATSGPGGAGPLAVLPTPPPATTRSTVRVWDEATRPSGPAPDPDRRYPARDQQGAQHLVDVHDHLRGELAQVLDLVAQVAAGALDAGSARSRLNEMTMRQNAWVLGSYCQSYCRVVATHHGLEDQAVFPHLRRADARLGPVLDRLEQEHHVIHDLLEGVDRALVAAVSGPSGLTGLQAAVDVLADSLLSHLAYEERELVEPIARLEMGLS